MSLKLFSFRSREEALGLQTRLAWLVSERTPPGFSPRLVCGLDAAYSRGHGFASAVVWDSVASTVTEAAGSKALVEVRYQPGFLGFREGPLLLSAAEKLRTGPAVFLVDGHGRAHPRGFGLACHVGLALNRPTVGVAKSHLYGEIVGENIISQGGKVLGEVVKTRNGKAYYVSVGHRIGLDDAVHVVRECLVNNHPAPLRAAHLESAKLRRLSA